MIKPLKIATCNANGLAKHSQKIKTFTFSQNIDILLVSETYFTKKSYYCIPEYTLYISITQCTLKIGKLTEVLLLL